MVLLDLEQFELLQDELDALQQDEHVFLTENGEKKYAVIPMDLYNLMEEFQMLFDDAYASPVVKVDSANLDLSYDEYERIKQQILEAVEKTLMPKPEKLN